MSASRELGLSMRLLAVLASSDTGLRVGELAAETDPARYSQDRDRSVTDCAAKLHWLRAGGFAVSNGQRGQFIWSITAAGLERLAAGDPRKVPRGFVHGTRYAYQKMLCRCDECRTWQHDNFQDYRSRHPELGARSTQYNREWRHANPEKAAAKRKRDAALSQEQNAAMAARAIERGRHWQRWTGPDLEIAARPDLTATEVAVMIGRSIRSVECMRQRLRDANPRRDLRNPSSLREGWPGDQG